MNVYNTDTNINFERNINYMQDETNTESRVANQSVGQAQGTLFKDLLIPIAIVIAGVFVAGALYFGGSPVGVNQPATAGNAGQPTAAVDTTNKVSPVTADDHIRGSIDAPIKIVEFSDFECPFCQRFHNTTQDLMDKYGANGELAIVFRHMPLEQLHPVKSHAVAVATECATEQGGNDAFWKFADRYFELTQTNNRTDIEKVIPQIVAENGLNKQAFNTCFESGKYDEKINASIVNGSETGGRGTPWSILIGPSGKTYPINGALPQAAIEQMIETAKKEA